MSSEGKNDALAPAVRLDKWLWAARMFKTRALAATAVQGGKVHLNGARVKPAKAVRAGDTLVIHRGEDELAVSVLAVSERRGPAALAAMLYEESAESRAARAHRAAERAAAARVPLHEGRPTKRDRRTLDRFTRRD